MVWTKVNKILITWRKQWRIQDFLEQGTPTPEGDANTLFDQFFSKNCMKLRKFWPKGAGCEGRPPHLDLPQENKSPIFVAIENISTGSLFFWEMAWCFSNVHNALKKLFSSFTWTFHYVITQLWSCRHEALTILRSLMIYELLSVGKRKKQINVFEAFYSFWL